MKLNLACGSTYVDGDGWVNFDFAPLSPNVRQADLLQSLPIHDDSADIVYTSHFLEHVPRNSVAGFLEECRRVLKPGGSLRIVVPDLEDICRTYLAERDAGRDDRADFVALELIDQCVRKESGGKLGQYYDDLTKRMADQPAMVSFVAERTGHNLVEFGVAEECGSKKKPGLAARVSRKLSALRLRVGLALLPAGFRSQNVSLAEIGETHQWVWDFHMLRAVLLDCDFVDIARCDCRSSRIPAFPVEALDLDQNNQPRKGTGSMYVEARKPTR
ncbi:methyltransferase domain-containing protein [Wenzhouxiangella sp. XN79A]|uniref:class I SAM-dependent methyltransferase n=1 Tax=Wenzhouxiangella sp. XN79A TaxID=2724193 RepID=UPI00144AE849|nr:methyltransferase domain-containing protein [Wenzhouxiangella sp. XN79A]NKI36426.1 methyltransferase domain-containing protein [Wenzhouxiangella sp. XN79A]